MTTLPATRQTHSPASKPDAGRPAIGLTIAGSDSGGGAGIQADLKAFSALGVYGASVITALTAQNTRTVTAVHEVPTEIVAAQIAAVFDDLPVDAVKVGMLSSPQVIRCVAKGLANLSIPTVLDPVMVAKSGDALLQDAAVETLRTELLPLAALLTPNLPEAARLLETVPARTEPEMEAQGCKLLELGPAAVLMKGGHADGAVCVDILVSQARRRCDSRPSVWIHATRTAPAARCRPPSPRASPRRCRSTRPCPKRTPTFKAPSLPVRTNASATDTDRCTTSTGSGTDALCVFPLSAPAWQG